MSRRGGVGGGLVSAGLTQQADAQQILGNAADQEQERLISNKRMESARKAGNKQLGASAGAMIGFQVGGPVGALVGGIGGLIAGGLF
jgi:hypothetical protein